MAESWLTKRKVRKRWWTIDQMYSEMQQTRNQGDPETSAPSKLRANIAPSVGWTTLMILVGVFMYWRTMGAVLCDPILKGPPQFILLAIIVALSAYLRAVRSSAVEQRDKIASGKVWNYPLEPPYRPLPKESSNSWTASPRS